VSAADSWREIAFPPVNANEVRLEGLEARFWTTRESLVHYGNSEVGSGRILAYEPSAGNRVGVKPEAPTGYRNKNVVEVATTPSKLRRQSEQKGEKRLAGFYYNLLLF
jgi:hypothetical protein